MNFFLCVSVSEAMPIHAKPIHEKIQTIIKFDARKCAADLVFTLFFRGLVFDEVALWCRRWQELLKTFFFWSSLFGFLSFSCMSMVERNKCIKMETTKENYRMQKNKMLGSGEWAVGVKLEEQEEEDGNLLERQNNTIQYKKRKRSIIKQSIA